MRRNEPANQISRKPIHLLKQKLGKNKYQSLTFKVHLYKSESESDSDVAPDGFLEKAIVYIRKRQRSKKQESIPVECLPTAL